MPKLKFLNANGDFVLTDADQAAETYFPLANEGGIISSITPRLAGDCKTGQDTFLLARAASRLCTKAVRRAISGCNLPTERCGAPPGKARPSRRRASAKGRTRSCCTAGFCGRRSSAPTVRLA